MRWEIFTKSHKGREGGDPVMPMLRSGTTSSFGSSAKEVERHAHVILHQGKTQVWNRGGEARKALSQSPGLLAR